MHSVTSDREHTCLKLLGAKFADPLERLRLATVQVFGSKSDHIQWYVLRLLLFRGGIGRVRAGNWEGDKISKRGLPESLVSTVP